MLKSILPDEARDILLGLAAAPITERVPIGDAAGRVLAEDVTATVPIPPFDRSPFDGYAFRGEDTANASRETPVTLKITEEIPAGHVPTVEITHGFAAKILTGSPLPVGANVTVKYEYTEFTDTEVTIFQPIPPNKDVIYAGSDVAVGEVVARRGDVLHPPLLGLLASEGIAEVAVFKAPRAAIINTGTELCEPGQPLPPAKIYNSSVFTLSGYLREVGVQAWNAGVVRDEPAEIAARIKDALAVSDVVITTGGASVGDYDCALRAAELLGAETLFWKTKLKPGGAVVASVLGGKLILALSGNPGAAVIFLLRVALPYMKKLCGRTDCLPETIEVLLKEPFTKESTRVRLLRGRLEISGGTAYFVERGGQGGGDIGSLKGCDLLAELPAGSPKLPAGTLVRAYVVN
ncbi:MAG: molybdopterin molybdotransferase MoeA [Oscillospiraceae bacterium]|jgi:molybdopterin molybdotransferase|nr:molybdopterin molybdotransferase MoeA [Oscillospiraceae bacterium]